MDGMEAGSCSCDAGDYEGAAVSSVKKVKARKEHVCDECGETIEKGRYYHRWSFLSEGRWESGKRCDPCWSIGRDFFCGILGKGAVRDHCWEYLGVDLITGETNDR